MDPQMMKMICLTPVVACILLVAADHICVADVDATSTTIVCTNFALPNGYPCKEYTVTTSDGYILTIQRIEHGRAGPQVGASRPPVILAAGVLQEAAQWLLNSPEQSLGYILPDAGFDVWFLNFRGTTDSSRHVSLSTEDKEFWDWSLDELASFDIPATLQLVYQTTGSQAYYIGHSQGTTVALAAFINTNVRQMVKAAVLLSPIVYLHHITSQVGLAFSYMYLDQVYLLSGASNFNISSGSLGSALLDQACVKVNCGDILNSFTGASSEFNSSRMGFYSKFMPQPTSANNIAHLAQLVRNDGLRKYDMGQVGNMNKYGQATSPEYNISSIPKEFPVLLALGGLDHLSDPVDVQNLIYDLRCSVKTIYNPHYGHADYILGINAWKEAYPQVINFLRSF
ncbi:hypothetical protein O6H91_06G068300 [Diphasiastrum complanatum]|uniref:Uncharacterized protein n=1 Tax=Diphasiastrum complanatum TaxID=34168 RepID=A0ACC2DF35_DIPCM|nr:hypothetical protein O6H91_06G068300 [Diphasiastrum complanatum]